MSVLNLTGSSLTQARLGDTPAEIELHGQLDQGEVELLCAQLWRLGRPAVVDFSPLRQISDAALGFFAEWLDATPPVQPLQLVGLDSHTAFVLRAFGHRVVARADDGPDD